MNSDRSEEPKGNILIVDDTPDNLRLLSAALTERGYKVRNAINGSMALIGAKAALPDLILLDIKMPDFDGYEVCKQLKMDPATREIPVIFLSALDEVFDKVRAFSVGGVDYINKPFQIEEVLARVENQLAIRVAKAEIRQLNAELEQRVYQRTLQLQVANQKLEQEILERQRVEEQLLYLATHDSLTNLPNRNLFLEELKQAIDRAHQGENNCFAVLFLDCDRFKIVNDSLGHLIGDQLLIAIARRLELSLNPGDILARLGGDEFTILQHRITNIHQATHLAEQIHQELSLPFRLEDYEIFINVSIGIVLGNNSYEQPEHLLRDADTAMYRAKALGKARYQVFDQGMHARALKLWKLETDLRLAVERQEFVVYYQPIVSLFTHQITGFEALLRWFHPQRGLVSPTQFIPAAEDTGLIVPIGLWVLRQACYQLGLWQRKYPNLSSLTVSVNLSVKQFSQPNLIEKIDQILSETQLSGKSLKLEITESAIMDNPESARAILEQLRRREIQLSIDDFGTGYSSLSYLHRFPVDTLKIDRSFVSRIGERGENLEIVQAIVTLAHNLGMNAIAEGVEIASQIPQLKALGCEFAQGYFFSKPVDSTTAGVMILIPDIREHLRNRKRGKR